MTAVQVNYHPIAVERRRQGLSQMRVAIKAGLSLGTMRNAEAGMASRVTIAKIARVLGVPYDKLSRRNAAHSTEDRIAALEKMVADARRDLASQQRAEDFVDDVLDACDEPSAKEISDDWHADQESKREREG